jgi:sugar phosphate isomerase/epimerase
VQLNHGIHLGYCTNIHPAESWEETLRALEKYTLRVKDRVAPKEPYGIGLRLSDTASRELAKPHTLTAFRRWLDRHQCYVFTINGFPFGRFHGSRVKEKVFLPDWTSELRLDYTCRLFDLLAALKPANVGGSVSTLPGSFKEFRPEEIQIRHNLWRCIEHVERVSEATGADLHLGLEPEPLGWLETSSEVVDFFDRMQVARPGDLRLRRFLGINYDACHHAVEFENAVEAVAGLRAAGIRFSKIHLSAALSVTPDTEALKALATFADDTYLHQVITRGVGGSLRRFKDLPEALDCTDRSPDSEWRIHFHVPLNAEPSRFFGTTSSHAVELLEILASEPSLCSHLEMETYTWSVLPAPLKSPDVVDQIEREYKWTLQHLRRIHLS